MKLNDGGNIFGTSSSGFALFEVFLADFEQNNPNQPSFLANDVPMVVDREIIIGRR